MRQAQYQALEHVWLLPDHWTAAKQNIANGWKWPGPLPESSAMKPPFAVGLSA